MNSFRLLTHRLNKFPDRPRYRAQWANWIRLFHWRSLAIRQHCNYWNRPRRTSTPLRPASSTDEIPWKIFFQTQRPPNSLFPAKQIIQINSLRSDGMLHKTCTMVHDRLTCMQISDADFYWTAAGTRGRCGGAVWRHRDPPTFTHCRGQRK